jgi:hypothetical protein
MRHSTIELTMNTSSDPRLLDMAGALDVPPELSQMIDLTPSGRRRRARTGDKRKRAPQTAALAGREILYQRLYQLPAKRVRTGRKLAQAAMSGLRVEPAEVLRLTRLAHPCRIMSESGRRDSNPQHSAGSCERCVEVSVLQ